MLGKMALKERKKSSTNSSKELVLSPIKLTAFKKP
jgi:hypothetical protein